MRNASTNTPADTPSEPPPQTEPSFAATPESAYPNMDTITLDNIDLAQPDIPARLAAIPEKIGYLHEIGLNYGYGPTSVLEWTIEHIHIYGGLPWWASIAATAVLLRLALLPFFIKSSDVMARSQALMSITKPITNRMQAASKQKRQADMMQAWGELRAVRKRAGVSNVAQFTPIVLQGVFGFCGFKLLRAASNLPVPAFKTDGFLWLSDLTIPDPYLILPIVMAGCIHLLIRIGGETGSANSLTPGMQKFMLYGMPGIIILGTGFQPGAVCVWFAAGGALGIVQSLALQRPALRAWLGLAPIYKPTQEEKDAGPFAAIMDAYKGGSGSTTQARPAVGRSAGYTNPTYQSPNLRNSSTSRGQQESRVIDVKAVTPRSGASDDMVTPSGTPGSKTKTKDPGVFDRASTAWKDFNKRTNSYMRNTPEGRAEKEAQAFRAAKVAYEKRAKEAEARAGGRAKR